MRGALSSLVEHRQPETASDARSRAHCGLLRQQPALLGDGEGHHRLGAAVAAGLPLASPRASGRAGSPQPSGPTQGAPSGDLSADRWCAQSERRRRHGGHHARGQRAAPCQRAMRQPGERPTGLSDRARRYLASPRRLAHLRRQPFYDASNPRIGALTLALSVGGYWAGAVAYLLLSDPGTDTSAYRREAPMNVRCC